MTAQDIENRNFSLAQAIYSEPHRVEKFLVLSPFAARAKRQAEIYAEATYGPGAKIYVYPRTYVKQARALLTEGRVATWA